MWIWDVILALMFGNQKESSASLLLRCMYGESLWLQAGLAALALLCIRVWFWPSDGKDRLIPSLQAIQKPMCLGAWNTLPRAACRLLSDAIGRGNDHRQGRCFPNLGSLCPPHYCQSWPMFGEEMLVGGEGRGNERKSWSPSQHLSSRAFRNLKAPAMHLHTWAQALKQAG
jgi:hypothetical protein